MFRVAFATTLLFGTFFFAFSKNQPKSASSDIPKRVIDAHIHVDPEEHKDIKDLRSEFAESNVVGAVVHASRRGGRYPKLSKEIAARFAVCAAAVPEDSIREAEKGLKEGRYKCLKIYLGYVPKFAYDAFYTPYYGLAEKYRVPVVFHTGDTNDKMALIKYAHPLTIDEIAVKYPKINFVLAHMGNPWTRTAAEVAYKNDNVYVDTSALMIGDLGKASQESLQTLIIEPIRFLFTYSENPKKILFGTDWPLTSVRPYLEAVAKAIPKEHWDAVFYENAARLFGLGEAGSQPAR